MELLIGNNILTKHSIQLEALDVFFSALCGITIKWLLFKHTLISKIETSQHIMLKIRRCNNIIRIIRILNQKIKSIKVLYFYRISAIKKSPFKKYFIFVLFQNKLL